MDRLSTRRRIARGCYSFEGPPPRRGLPQDREIARTFEQVFGESDAPLEVVLSPAESPPLPNSQLLIDKLREFTPSQLLRLKNYAKWRMRGLGRKAAGRTHEDLLAEALMATVSGERTWKPDVSLCEHLTGAMRSISSKWQRRRQVDLHLESDLNQWENLNFGRTGATGAVDPERILLAKEELRKIRRLFSRDVLALEILEFLALGWTETEILAKLRISRPQYGAAVKRIRRTLAVRYGG
jgi:hypothetical protein